MTAVKLEPTSARHADMVKSAYLELHDQARSMVEYERALSLEPSNALARANVVYLSTSTVDGMGGEERHDHLRALWDDLLDRINAKRRNPMMPSPISSSRRITRSRTIDLTQSSYESSRPRTPSTPPTEQARLLATTAASTTAQRPLAQVCGHSPDGRLPHYGLWQPPDYASNAIGLPDTAGARLGACHLLCKIGRSFGAEAAPHEGM